MPDNENISHLLEAAKKKMEELSERPSLSSEIDNKDELFSKDLEQASKITQEQIDALLKTPQIKQLIKDLESDRNLRKLFGYGLLIFLIIWSLLLFGVLVFNKWIGLPSELLVVLVSGTTVKIIGLVWVIIWGLFVRDRKYKID